MSHTTITVSSGGCRDNPRLRVHVTSDNGAGTYIDADQVTLRYGTSGTYDLTLTHDEIEKAMSLVELGKLLHTLGAI